MLKMVRVRSILVAMVICVTVLLTACGDNGKGDNQPSNTPSNEKPIQSTQEIKNGKKKLMRKIFGLCYRGCLFKEIY